MQGIYRTIFKNTFVEGVAAHRENICISNVCGLYNAAGDHENCYVPGEACCKGCGCKLSWKYRSLSSHCYLKDVGKKPMWDTVMTEEEEKEFREKTGLKNNYAS